MSAINPATFLNINANQVIAKRCCDYKDCNEYRNLSNPNLSITFFGFPTHPVRKEKWIELSQTESENPRWICSRHFQPKYLSFNQRRVNLLGCAEPDSYKNVVKISKSKVEHESVSSDVEELYEGNVINELIYQTVSNKNNRNSIILTPNPKTKILKTVKVLNSMKRNVRNKSENDRSLIKKVKVYNNTHPKLQNEEIPDKNEENYKSEAILESEYYELDSQESINENEILELTPKSTPTTILNRNKRNSNILTTKTKTLKKVKVLNSLKRNVKSNSENDRSLTKKMKIYNIQNAQPQLQNEEILDNYKENSKSEEVLECEEKEHNLNKYYELDSQESINENEILELTPKPTPTTVTTQSLRPPSQQSKEAKTVEIDKEIFIQMPKHVYLAEKQELLDEIEKYKNIIKKFKLQLNELDLD